MDYRLIFIQICFNASFLPKLLLNSSIILVVMLAIIVKGGIFKEMGRNNYEFWVDMLGRSIYRAVVGPIEVVELMFVLLN